MQFLDFRQIKKWYKTSLSTSGWEKLDILPRQIWKNAVVQGRTSLPPGFVANLFERLTRKSWGKRSDASSFSLETELLDKIYSGKGFEHIEGIFILHGEKTVSSQ